MRAFALRQKIVMRAKLSAVHQAEIRDLFENVDLTWREPNQEAIQRYFGLGDFSVHGFREVGVSTGLTSARGPGGGFSLAVAPQVLTVGDVVEVFADARPDGARCLLRDAACDQTRPCSAHLRWTEVTTGAREPLLRTTIGELCAEQQLRPVVGQPMTTDASVRQVGNPL